VVMSARNRIYNGVEISFSLKRAAGAIVGFSDPDQYELDYDRFLKRSLKRNMEDRDKFNDKIGANFDARANVTAAGCRIQTENAANEAVIAHKQKNLGGISASDRELNDAFDRAEEDRKHVEKTRRLEAKLNALNGRSINLGGAAADRRDARMDKQQDPESEYEMEGDESECEPEIQVVTKKSKKEVASPEKKGKEVAVIEEKKEISTKAPLGFLASLFGGMSTQEDPGVRVQKIARLAYHVKKLNSSYRLNDEEERALAALGAFPHWLRDPTTMEEAEQILQALMKQTI